jgi:Caspase recruitment domain
VLTIDTQHSGLVAELYAKDVIDHQDKDYLEAEWSSIRRNEKLLSMLARKSKEQFDLFLDGLSGNGQEHVVSKIRGDKESAGETVNTSS